MHIVILAESIDNQKAGVHTYTKNLIENLLSIDEENTYTFIHEKQNPFFEGKNHYIVPRKKSPGSSTYRKFFELPSLIKNLKPDIVIEPCHIGPFRLPKDIKRVTVIHDLTPILFPKFHIKNSTIVHKLLLKKIIRNADLILVASQNTKNDIIKYCKGNHNIKVIPLGINAPKETEKSVPYIPYFLYLGTIEPRKNIETLIDAFTELKADKLIPHKLVLAGETGWKSKKVLQKIEKATRDFPGQIIITGFVDEEEKAALYKNADIFIYPSIYEGFGLPPLEAMSYGIPVICSNGGSLKEIFQNKTLMFSPKDKEKLKSLILSLVNNRELKEKLSKNGFEYTKLFTWEQTAQKTLLALKDLVK